MAPPVWRRTPVIVAAGLVALALVSAAVFLATHKTSGGLGGISPNHVGIIDPKTNEIVDEIQVGLRPGPVAVREGVAWIGNLDEKTLTKIDAMRHASAGTYPLDNLTPTGVAVGEGSVWVAHGVLGKLSAVDPEFGQVKKTIPVAAGEALGSTNGAVATSPGAVWAVFADSTLARVDPIDIEVSGRGVTGTAPAGIVVAYDLVWVVNTDSATVQRFDPATFDEGALGTPITVGLQPTAIAAGGGAIWVANTGADTVERIQPATAGGAPTTEQIDVGDAPTGVAVGAGAVWVANAGDGTVSRIDVAKRKVVKTIHIGNAPSGIAFGNGVVWLTVQSP
jgi:serine/threonine-protein kinase